MLSLLVILRAIVSQADKQSLAPLVYVVVAALVLLCIYILTNPASHALAFSTGALRGAAMISPRGRSRGGYRERFAAAMVGLAIALLISGLGIGLGIWQHMPAQQIIFYAVITFALVAGFGTITPAAGTRRGLRRPNTTQTATPLSDQTERSSGDLSRGTAPR